MPIVTLTVIPGFRSTIVARCPFTLISVNWVMINVRVVFPSVTVIALPVTPEMIGGWYPGTGVAFFLLLPARAGVAVITASRVQTATNGVKRDFFMDSV